MGDQSGSSGRRVRRGPGHVGSYMQTELNIVTVILDFVT